jgi:hypothetical protein
LYPGCIIIDIALLIKCALKAGATIIKNDAGRPAGIYVKGEPFDIKDLFINNNNNI